MSYTMPQNHKCPKCGHETKFGPDDKWDKSPVTEDGNPVCPKCWNSFLGWLGATMRCTEAWSKEGSDYDRFVKEMQKAADFRRKTDFCTTPFNDFVKNR